MRLRYFLIPAVCVISSLVYSQYRRMSSVKEDTVVTTDPAPKPTGATSVPSLPRLYLDIKPTQLPIIYCTSYDISFFGFEKLHPFDTQKWGHIFKFLLEAGILANKAQSVEPLQAIDTELLTHHTRRYIDSLSVSFNVAAIAEIPPVAAIPNFLVQKVLLTPIRYQTGGTILGGKLAMERGWAINLGGGFHHCSQDRGGGFCFYADISICIHYLFNHMPELVKKVMIIDLDAHQGNGHETDFINDDRVYILDVYNRGIYPADREAKAAIDLKIELAPGTDDTTFLSHIHVAIPQALSSFKPDMVLYNAGTDILINDRLGALNITREGVITRDEIVWEECRERGIPILMVTSGGYQAITGRIVADSIINLQSKGFLK